MNEQLRPTQGIKEYIRGKEAFRSKTYICPAGIPTIGYGSTRWFNLPGAPKVQMGQTITEPDARVLMDYTLDDFWLNVAKHINVPLTQNQVDAISSFVYNVGVKAFLGSTLYRKLNAGDFAGAAAQFPRWNRGGGKVKPGLVKRRDFERRLFLGEVTV